MSFRTKLIMDLATQQASHSCVDIVEYVVGKDGTLSPVYAQPSSRINESILNSIEVPPPNDATIKTASDHLDFPIDLNDAISMNNELENPQIPGTEQDEDNTNNTITNISSEHDDLDVSYVLEENDSDSSSANEHNFNNSEERNESGISLHPTKTRRKRKFSESWNYNLNKYKRLKGQPYQGKKEITGIWNYNINKPGT